VGNDVDDGNSSAEVRKPLSMRRLFENGVHVVVCKQEEGLQSKERPGATEETFG
jgi:hypothetical protein